MKILVAGCGSIGIRHLACLPQSAGGAEISAFDVDPAAEGKVRTVASGIRFFSDWREALARGNDLVIVCVPNELHEELSVAALRSGSHVLCEKPIAHDVAAGRRMVEEARRAGRILAVGYTERFRPSFEFVEGKALSGDLGRLVGGRAMVGTYNTLLCARTDFRSRAYGALLVDYTHEIDMLGSMFGEVRSLACRANRLAAKPVPSDPSLVAMLLEYRSGAVVSLHCDYVQHPQRRLMEVYGDRGTIEFDLQADCVKVFDGDSPGVVELRQFDNVRNDRFVREHRDVLEAIRLGRRPRVDGEQALRALEVAETAVRQLRDGQA